METTKYKRRPIYVDAVRVTEENFKEVAAWCQGEIAGKFIQVRVVNPQRPRQTKAFVGDWVLYSDYNGYKVYTDGAFRNSFLTVTGMEIAATEAQMEMVPDGTYGGARKA